MKKKLKALSLLLIPLIIDQIIKSIIYTKESVNLTIIPGLLKLSYVKNTGGAYGLGADSILVLIGVNLILVVLIISYLVKNYKTIIPSVKLGLLLMLSGGISNLLDRLFKGYVIDYIDINKLINYPVFNIADICIVAGVIIIIITIIVNTLNEQENQKKG